MPALRSPVSVTGCDRERLLVRAFDHAPIGMGVLTPHGLITLCNAALGALLGRRCDDLIGTMFLEIVHPDDRAAAERALALDPAFALAHAALSELHGEIYNIRYDPSRDRAAQAAPEVKP